MPDIFLSYNREDQTVARRFAEAFEREGFSVWWDVSLRSGEAYDRITEQALSDAKAVVVLWSPRSVESRWVRAEATHADREGKLVPVMIEDCKRPIMFELTQTADLIHWNGDPRNKQWHAFLEDVKAFVRKQPSATPEPRLASEPAKAPLNRPLITLFKRPAILGGIATAIALIAIVAVFTLRPQAGPAQATPTNQRIAFFGFTPASADPLVSDIAVAATDETFQALLALRLEAASRADTQGVELALQRTKAGELDAAYALGGEVRSAGSVINIRMHLEDVASRTTLWEKTVSGGGADKASLPVLAAGAATSVARCMAAARPSLPRQDGELLAELAAACATPFIAYLDAPTRWRALARQAPDSAVILANLSNSLIYHANHSRLTTAELREVWKEATTAAQRALAIEPDNGIARTVLAYNAIFEGRPVAEAGALMDAAFKDSPDDWRRGETGSNRTEFLKGVGRSSEALAAAQAAIGRNPLSPTPYMQLAEVLLHVGRGPEAGRVFAQMNARWPDAWWGIRASYAVRFGINDLDEVLAAAPSGLSEESKTCWRQLAKAYTSSSPAVRRAGVDIAVQCGADGRIAADLSEVMRIRLLNDFEGLLARYGAGLNHSLPSTGFLFNAGELFGKTERAFRADPQFLPLMKKSGLYQYWLDTGTHPDVCDLPEEKNFEVCAKLRADQADK